MSKQKLSHKLPNGEIATRTTARNYTHVVIAKTNVERMIAGNQLTQKELDKVAESAAYDYKYAAKIVQVPVGEKFFYHRHQGGAYLNRSGKHMEVQQYNHDHAKEFHLDLFESAEAAAAAAVVKRVNDNKLWQDGMRAKEPEEFLNSWHGRADLAEKEAARLYSHGYDVIVEAINNGERV